MARGFLAGYQKRYPFLQSLASRTRDFISDVLQGENVPYYSVTARAKSVDSVREKLLKKAYTRPARQVMDQVGERVIVLRASEVDGVAECLRSRLDVVEKDSADKRQALGLREFGYRSYHLVCRYGRGIDGGSGLVVGAPKVFEVQVRSLLDHVWAEIEHGVVYKAGANLPDLIKRRFASLAGALEMLEREFQALTDEAGGLVDSAKATISFGALSKMPLDVPGLIALLETRVPNGLGFRGDGVGARPFPPGIEWRIVLAMRGAGIESVGSLDKILRSAQFRVWRRRYLASLQGVDSEVSHLGVCLLVLGSRRMWLVSTYFPEFAQDIHLNAALAG